MSIMRIEILNPKASKLLKNLAELNLISIKEEDPESEFIKTLSSLRNHSKAVPSLDDITKEVEAVRSEKYGK